MWNKKVTIYSFVINLTRQAELENREDPTNLSVKSVTNVNLAKTNAVLLSVWNEI